MSLLNYPKKVVLGDITVRDGLQHEERFIPTDASLGLAIDLAALPCKFLNRYGNHYQKQKYLTKITSGEYGAAIALTEPNHGSDITEMDTTAI